MAQGKPQLTFERNPGIKFRDNCDTDGRRTDDRRRTNCDFMSSADIELKMYLEKQRLWCRLHS